MIMVLKELVFNRLEDAGLAEANSDRSQSEHNNENDDDSNFHRVFLLI